MKPKPRTVHELAKDLIDQANEHQAKIAYAYLLHLIK